MVGNAKWEFIDIRIPQKMIKWKQTPILVPTASEYRIGIVKHDGDYLAIENDELSEQLARQLIHIIYQRKLLLEGKGS